jgi:hypothetical protein
MTSVSNHFEQNPFFILGATTHDDRRTLAALAEARELQVESGLCQQSRADLTNPRSRLSAEIGWLPGVTADESTVVVGLLRTNPLAIRRLSALPPLARANALAAVRPGAGAAAADHAEFINEMNSAVDEISAAAVMQDVNRDRAVSGFPQVQWLDLVENELADRLRHFRSIIRAGLDTLPSETIVDIMRTVVLRATGRGGQHANILAYALTDGYEMETRAVLQQEAATARLLMDGVRQKAAIGAAAVEPFLVQLETVLRQWDRIARPIQQCYEARGLDYEPGIQLGFAVRNLALALWNQRRMLEASTRLTSLSIELFLAIPPLAEQLNEDRTAYAKIADSLNYTVGVGWFNHTLSISAQGVQWKRKYYPIESITRIRWGSMTVTVNGVPKPTKYTIAFGDARRAPCIETRRKEIFAKFTEKLWSTAGIRLLSEFLDILKAGGTVRFGDALFRDHGVELTERKLFGPDTIVRCAWDQLVVRNFNGALEVSAKHHPAARVQLNFMEVANVHILAKALESVMQPPYKQRMSDLLSP